MIAVAVALYAVGRVMKDAAEARGSGDDVHTLILVAIGFAIFSSAIFAGDLIYLAIKEYQRLKALRIRRPAYGQLDYIPEFQKATSEYGTAQQCITDAMGASRLTELNEQMNRQTDDIRKQAVGIEIGEDIAKVSSAIETNLVIMNDRAIIMLLCLRGFLKYAKINTTADWNGLLALRKTNRETRQKTSTLRSSIETARGGVKVLRERNLSSSVNDSAKILDKQLIAYRRGTATITRYFGQIDSAIHRKLIANSIGRLILRKALIQPESSVREYRGIEKGYSDC